METTLNGLDLATFAQNFTAMTLAIVALMVWELIWKGMALWHSAKAGHKVWFICLLLLNTVGILPIIYLLMHSNTFSGKKL